MAAPTHVASNTLFRNSPPFRSSDMSGHTSTHPSEGTWPRYALNDQSSALLSMRELETIQRVESLDGMTQNSSRQ